MTQSSPPLVAGPAGLTARRAAASIAAGELSSQALVQACLERIAQREPQVRAWACVNAEAALREARERDASPARGPLHGVPIAVKDVIDTAGLPTGMGSPIYDGYQPFSDAACVAMLRAAGAVVLGKTVTAEFAGVAPGPTTHPLAPQHTPGGSSSGSAAAVADCMVPLALGTQTGGSILRPAAFCGIVGFKPTFGTVSRSGLKMAAESFDTIGLMARDVDDVALAWGALVGSTRVLPYPTRAPRLRLFRGHYWDHASPDAEATLARVSESLRSRDWTVEELPTPPGFAELSEARVLINGYERARALAWEHQHHAQSISPAMRRVVDAGWAVDYERYIEAVKTTERWRTWFADTLQGWDAIVTPSTNGEAPLGLDSTGAATFQEIWTLLRAPTITLPLGTGHSGLPVGVQFVGAPYGDAALLAMARRVMKELSNNMESERCPSGV
ncbi:amidase (plasmid) [Alicycliphilus denitrificans]|uniref:Amidase n=1 Tax=Alicycliphilus denitrificans TaxID=179636 RepID=A0A858ZMZ1_9BURK|nr:amidase [Alicycliphilus denitrificans]QKD42117.1 amidase [Alicycliphilus denitrificans]